MGDGGGGFWVLQTEILPWHEQIYLNASTHLHNVYAPLCGMLIFNGLEGEQCRKKVLFFNNGSSGALSLRAFMWTPRLSLITGHDELHLQSRTQSSLCLSVTVRIRQTNSQPVYLFHHIFVPVQALCLLRFEFEKYTNGSTQRYDHPSCIKFPFFVTT